MFWTVGEGVDAGFQTKVLQVFGAVPSASSARFQRVPEGSSAGSCLTQRVAEL